MSYKTVELIREKDLVTVTLNRPDNHNAFNPEMIAELTAVFKQLATDESCRIILLTGKGRSFCAGADLSFMRAAAEFSFAENVVDGEKIFDLMDTIDRCPKPVIGRINGAAIGGGAGLVSCCDIVVAVERAKFGFSEARLGIAPAVISPFVLAKIGVSNGRELFLTGELFRAPHAEKIGLVHHVVADEAALDAKVVERIEAVRQAAPGAQATIKELVKEVAYQEKRAARPYTTNLIAERRASTEGREGMSSFLEKRKASWQVDNERLEKKLPT